MRSITFHWTAGSHRPSIEDRNHYHFIVDGDGKIYRGKFRPEDNIPPLHDGYYAAHCGGGNSFNIGISLCGMAGYTSPGRPGPYPLTRKSYEAACKLAAQLSHQYDIPIDAAHIFTHAEFGWGHPATSSHGKIDITWLPWEPGVRPKEVGTKIRNTVKWYADQL